MGFKRVTVIGGSGMLGQDLVPHLSSCGYQVSAPTIGQVNVLHDVERITTELAATQPEIIIHAAAYTDVDGAERDPELAMAINKDGTRKIAVAARDIGAILVYISTDYVFDGTTNRPLTTDDKPHPINMYGQSKFYGELMVSELLDTHYILRTSWLYGMGRNNFVQWVLASAKQGQPINVVNDWHGTPTWTGSLAHTIETVMTSGAFGTYHTADQGTVSKYEQAVAICKAAGLSHRHISPVSASTLSFDAPRPAYTPLDCAPLAMPHWETSLAAYLTQYFADPHPPNQAGA